MRAPWESSATTRGVPETAYACMLCGMELPESGPVDWGNARFAASHVSCGAEYDRREHNDLCGILRRSACRRQRQTHTRTVWYRQVARRVLRIHRLPGGLLMVCTYCGQRRSMDTVVGFYTHNNCHDEFKRRYDADICTRCGEADAAVGSVFCNGCDADSPYVGYPEGL